MTDLLRKAFEEASKLLPEEQDAFATLMLEEMEGEARWSATLATRESRDLLRRLADEAVAEHRAGKSEALDLDRL